MPLKFHCAIKELGNRPIADMVIYDGACRLCQETIGWLERLDKRGRLTYLPFQDPRIADFYPDLSQRELEKHVHVIDNHGERHKGAGAVRYLARRIPALWGLVPLVYLPGSMPVWRWLYNQIARRRHMLDHVK